MDVDTPATVKMMIIDNSGVTPTAPLNDFLLAYSAEDNMWWRISCGHHMNLFDEATDRLDAALHLHPVHCTTCGVDNCRTRRVLKGAAID